MQDLIFRTEFKFNLSLVVLSSIKWITFLYQTRSHIKNLAEDVSELVLHSNSKIQLVQTGIWGFLDPRCNIPIKILCIMRRMFCPTHAHCILHDSDALRRQTSVFEDAQFRPWLDNDPNSSYCAILLTK